MKINKIEQVAEFLKTIDKCEGEVYLTSSFGDKYNLKSKLTQYVAIAGLLNSDNDLEFWCDNKKDEQFFIEFFNRNPEVL